MSRRRFRAAPALATAGGFSIGVTMTPVGAAPVVCPPVAAAASATVAGPFAVTTSTPYTFGEPCGWLVYMLGISDADTVSWSLTWDDMESTPDAAYFVLAESDYTEAPMAAQVVNAANFAVYGISVYCTVNGTVYGPVVIECAA